jgi:hypothetical protein
MKNALKCELELLDLVKIREIESVFSEKGQYLKKCLYEFHTLSSNPWLSVRECPNFLKICQISNFWYGLSEKKHVSG